MQKQRLVIVAILFLVAIAITILVTLPPQLGLDLKGGAQLTIQVQPDKPGVVVKESDTTAVKRVIENRINGLGVAEPITQLVGADRILVQLPGVTDPEQAERVLGGTAQLEFRPQSPDTEEEFSAQYNTQRQLEAQIAALRAEENITPETTAQISELEAILVQVNAVLFDLFEPVNLTGEGVTSAQPAPTQSGTSWQVLLNFNDQGSEIFATITKELAGTGRSVGIFLDEALISAPTVGAEYALQGISNNVTISGNFDIDSATDLAIQIRGGSLPFPVAVVENRTVGATLGQDSIRRSIYAGSAGLVLVLILWQFTTACLV